VSSDSASDPQARDPQASDPAFFPTDLMRAIGFDAVLRVDPAGVAVVRYVARPKHAHSNGRVVQGGFITSWLRWRSP
jgi:acyl-coenzyme A thioesterase PaaI-like protein